MKSLIVGIVDYGMGNHASVIHALRNIGFQVKISDEREILDKSDLLLLPGVGAFPDAMKALHERDLVNYLKMRANDSCPIVGICLGMQLLSSSSSEFGYTKGLDLIPGEVKSLQEPKWHIGWNSIECVQEDPILSLNDGQVFYFNHSFCFNGSSEYQIAVSRYHAPIVSVIRHGKVVGLQFHPEKSQSGGRQLLENLIKGLCSA
ncbi:imidazole glycerol phosphate synthase subunit HisH [Methylophaga nitratireducenticrescens]|uniref:imidazole glycerol phosphate synthase subunit HisH n=1 Tax=Methylophaga nitratireducenticrescens TaxID=754476 RepID=UPI000CDC3BC1|nr:imidazole glycerol phosphate synthase subunit HisH [Methylophaga nitratireducenticrescens]AUZ84048.1 imidazole glycerol phosphate synthase subunit HisH [Methylophaga nitratireducenticrescens]